MHNAGLKNEEYVSRLQISGSNAVKRKNEAGVNLFESSDLSDGVIPGKLIRPKYNQDELVKAVDTRIFELIPQEVPIGPATVLRSVYQEALDEIDALNADKVRLENIINQLNSTIRSLEAAIQNLNVELDGAELKASVAENQAETASEAVADTTSDLSNAIQNATQEAIQRVSLTARNAALKDQIAVLLKNIASLEEQVSGATAKRAKTSTAVAAGAELLGDNVIVKNLQEPSGGKKDIDIVSSRKNGTHRFESGEKFEIENLGENSITITITKKNEAANLLSGGGNVTVPAGSKKVVTFTLNKSKWGDKKPKKWYHSKKDYDGSVTFKASTGDEQTFSFHLRKNTK